MYPDDQGLIDGATPPASDLVIAQFDTLFALLQSAFDPLALACMNAKWAIGVSIGPGGDGHGQGTSAGDWVGGEFLADAQD